jgi:membrane protease YdiL (CAAX protease family)
VPTVADLLYVAVFAVAWPLFDYFVLWPAFLRRSQTDPERARMGLYLVTIAQQWALVAAGVALWSSRGRSWDSFGLFPPDGWRLWGAIALALAIAAYQARVATLVALSTRASESVRKQLGSLSVLLPHTRSQLACFVGVSLTAGFCEEFLYRGYLVWAFGQWLGWWGAAALAVPFFAFLHAYQGSSGIIRAGIAGIVFTLIVAVSGSLWPAMLLHMLVDIGSGVIAWVAFRGDPARTGAVSAGGSPQRSQRGGPAEPSAAPDRGGLS